ncbi:hypothetical protein SVIOM342S_07118 [Streptomyces violaceorubidus]
MNHAQLTALGRALRLLGEHGEALTADTPEAKLHEVRADLKRALDQLEESVTTAAPSTRCPEHPNGPVVQGRPRPVPAVRYPPPHGPPRGVQRRTAAGPARRAGPVPLRRTGRLRPQPQQRWLPEQWTGQAWQLCGTPRRDRREAELYIAAQLRGPRAAMAYRLVHEFTDYEVLRVWGTPVRVDIAPMGGL